MKIFIRKYSVSVVILTILFLIIRGEFFSRSPVVIAFQSFGVTLALWAKYIFRKQQFSAVADPGSGPLIKNGPYRFVRHPMYSAVLILIWASIFGHLSIFNASIGAIVLIVILFRISMEEKLLRERYPEYESYSRETKRLIPCIY
jgi:protein-S-isoprenylcysteine O-methyltransferase Ste14